MPLADPHEVYRRWIDDVWSRVDADVAAVLIADEFVGHWPDRDIAGRAALLAAVRQVHELVPGLRFRVVVGPIVEGDLVAGRWDGHGADGGERFTGNDLLRLADGRVVEYWQASSPS